MSDAVIVAVAQMDYVPAFSDAGRDFLAEPDFQPFTPPTAATLFDFLLRMRKDSGPEAEQVADAIVSWKAELRSAYEAYIGRKVAAVLDLAREIGVDVLVFPEYSIPCDVLPLIPTLLPDATVIAGTHTIEESCRGRCGSLGFDIQPDDVGMALCPVFVGREQRLAVHKLGPSRWESSLLKGRPSAPFTITRNDTRFAIRVKVCIDFLDRDPAETPRDNDGDVIVAVPAYTPDTSADFEHRAQEYAKRQDHVVALANAAIAGGSRIYYDGGASGLPMQDATGTWRAAPREELIIAARIVGTRSRTRTFSPIPTPPVSRQQVAVIPLLYPSYSERDQVLTDLRAAEPHDVAAVLSAHRTSFASLQRPTVRTKIDELRVRHGGLDHEQVRRLGEIRLLPPDVPTLDEWRYRALLATARRFDELAAAHATTTALHGEIRNHLRLAAAGVITDAVLSFSLQQVERTLEPGEFFAGWLTAATRLLALPSSGEVDSAFARWATSQLADPAKTPGVRRVGTLVAEARPYPVKRLWKTLEVLLDSDATGLKAMAACQEHDRRKGACSAALVARAIAAEVARPGHHYLLYGFSHAVIGMLREYSKRHDPSTLRLSVAECKNRLGVDSAPVQIARLGELGYKCRFVSNVSLGTFLQRERVNALWSGANAITPDGILNTMGSLAVAILAEHFKIPFVTLAASYKLWPQAEWATERSQVMKMQRPEGELLAEGRPAGDHVNYAYDVIPLELIHTLVSDEGVWTGYGAFKILFPLDGTDGESSRS
jgi:translation initiation factor 2B subunit (eIF-2B alpha/beta/delta family)